MLNGMNASTNPIRTPDRDSYRKDEGWGRYYFFGTEGPFLSVTNAIKLGIPNPYLNQWYAKVVAEYVDENWADLSELRSIPYHDENGDPFVRMLKAKPTEARDTAGDFGTEVHDICEDIMLNGPGRGELDKKVAQRINQFYAFQKQMNPSYVAVEGIVFNREYGFAGAFDFIADIPGVGRVLVDIKTGRGIYGTAAVQQVAYIHGEFIAVGSDEIPMIEVDAAYILHLQATQWRLIPVETGETSWSVFKSALNTAWWIVEHEDSAVGKPLVKGRA